MIQVVLTFLPVFVVGATVVAASATSGTARWLVLSTLPLLGTLASWAGLPISGENGNMLAVLLVLILTVGLVLYYPILLFLFVWKHRQGQIS